jgi:hypothetical protein
VSPPRLVQETSAVVVDPGGNLSGLCARRQQAGREAQIRAVREHGADPCSKQQTAAHEAGHVIVAHTFGERLKSSQIFAVQGPHAPAWVGNTNMVLPGRDASMRTSAAQDPSYALRSIMNTLAGICAEIAAGLDHPASSADERFFADAACADLAGVLGVPAARIMAAAVVLCQTALATNAVAFEVVRTSLQLHQRVTGLTLRPVLARAARLDFEAAAAQALAGRETDLPPPFAALVSESGLTLEPEKT